MSSSMVSVPLLSLSMARKAALMFSMSLLGGAFSATMRRASLLNGRSFLHAHQA